MGYYLNSYAGRPLPAKNKAMALISLGAQPINPPTEWQEGLVCAVVNPAPFDAVGYAYNEQEMKYFLDVTDPRPKQWFLIPEAAELSGYTK